MLLCVSAVMLRFSSILRRLVLLTAAAAMLGFHNMSVFVDRDVLRYADLCQGALVLSLELEDDWTLTWKEVIVCYLVVVPVKLIVAVGR